MKKIERINLEQKHRDGHPGSGVAVQEKESFTKAVIDYMFQVYLFKLTGDCKRNKQSNFTTFIGEYNFSTENEEDAHILKFLIMLLGCEKRNEGFWNYQNQKNFTLVITDTEADTLLKLAPFIKLWYSDLKEKKLPNEAQSSLSELKNMSNRNQRYDQTKRDARKSVIDFYKVLCEEEFREFFFQQVFTMGYVHPIAQEFSKNMALSITKPDNLDSLAKAIKGELKTRHPSKATEIDGLKSLADVCSFSLNFPPTNTNKPISGKGGSKFFKAPDSYYSCDIPEEDLPIPTCM